MQVTSHDESYLPAVLPSDGRLFPDVWPLHSLQSQDQQAMTINDLIERVSQATGPDREIDAAIEAAVRTKRAGFSSWVYSNFAEWRAREDGRVEVVHADGGGGVHWAPLSYTASVDAALTLVPEGWTRAVDASAPELRIDVTLFPPNDGPDLVGTHSSEPIATCIAALKARSQS